MPYLDNKVQNALLQLVAGLTQDGGTPGAAFRHDIGDISNGPDPAYLFAPHGSDSVRVYFNESAHPLANWFPLEPTDAVEDTVEFLSYLVPGITPDGPGDEDGNEACANCGQPSCSAITTGTCDSFGKTATLGPVLRWNAHLGMIQTASDAYEWTKVNARQNRGYPKSIISYIDGREIALDSKKKIFTYMAHYQWTHELFWSLWGGTGYNGSFPGVLETVRPGWAKENEYIIDGKGIPDNVYMDPKVIDLAGIAYYEQPWLFAERVQQVVTEMTNARRPPRRANVGGVNNVLVDFALVASMEWLTFFAKIAARVGMINEFGTMPNGFQFNVTTSESEKRFFEMTSGALGYGYLPTPYGNVPFIPETMCDPAKMPAGSCQRSADECDKADTYSSTMRLLVRRIGTENALALKYLDYRKTAAPPMNGEIVMGDSGRWVTSYPTSTNGFCERAVQRGELGMINRAPTLQTVFKNATFRQYLEPERYWPGSDWFKGGPPDTIKTVSTATRDLIQTDLGSGAVTLAGTATSISGSGNVWTIVSADLDGLDVVPVGTLFTSGAYTGHVSHYSDAANSITVLGDLSGVPAGSAFTLGVATACADCPDNDDIVVVATEPCEVVRATYTGTLVSATAGRTLVVDSTILEALADHALVGGYVYVAGAEVGRIASFLTPSDASIVLAKATNVPLAAGDTVTIYYDTGCESDNPDVEALEAFVTVPQIPVTGTDAIYVGFVSRTGATTTISPKTGYPVPDNTYIDVTSEAGMLATLTAQNASSAGVTKWVDVVYESDQVSGVEVTVRIPYSKA